MVLTLVYTTKILRLTMLDCHVGAVGHMNQKIDRMLY